MHVGHTAIFHNPGQASSDYQLCQGHMAIAPAPFDSDEVIAPALQVERQQRAA